MQRVHHRVSRTGQGGDLLLSPERDPPGSSAKDHDYHINSISTPSIHGQRIPPRRAAWKYISIAVLGGLFYLLGVWSELPSPYSDSNGQRRSQEKVLQGLSAVEQHVHALLGRQNANSTIQKSSQSQSVADLVSQANPCRQVNHLQCL